MATPKRPEIPDSKAFVRAVAKQLGAKGNVDFAEKMGWTGAQPPGNIGRWLAGKSSPSYENTMEMLERCGWLNMSEGVQPQDLIARDPLAALAAKVEELPTADDLGRAVATLQAAIDGLASRGSPAVQTKKPARKRGGR